MYREVTGYIKENHMIDKRGYRFWQGFPGAVIP